MICEYLEGRLTPQVAGDIQHHLGHCDNCRAVYDAAALTLEVYFDREMVNSTSRHSRIA